MIYNVVLHILSPIALPDGIFEASFNAQCYLAYFTVGTRPAFTFFACTPSLIRTNIWPMVSTCFFSLHHYCLRFPKLWLDSISVHI